MSFVRLEKLLTNWSDDLGSAPSSEQLTQFVRYAELLIEWNKRMNLTAIKEPDEIVVKHFMDSLSLLSELNQIASHSFWLVGSLFNYSKAHHL